MKLQDVIDWERQMLVLRNRLGPVLGEQERAALEKAHDFAAEIRHFAVSFVDAYDIRNISEARRITQSSIDRLVQNFRPE